LNVLSGLACIVLPSGESVCNYRKNNTTHSLHALVHNVHVISKEDMYFVLQY